MTKRKIILALLFGWLVGAIIHECRAGIYLDLDIGSHLNDWPGQTCTMTGASTVRVGYIIQAVPHCQNESSYLSNKNPIGIVRVGYETNKYTLFGPVDVRAHGYWQHMSGISDGSDSGIDVIMFGIRIE